MPTLKETQKSLTSAEQAMAPYQDPALASKVRAQVTEAWKPLYESSVNSTQNQMQDFNSRFANIPYAMQGAGTTDASLTPQQKMAYMGRELGTMGGRLHASAALSDFLGGKANDMAERAVEALRLGNQAAAERYQRAYQMYQLAWQEEEARKQREFQAAEAAKARAAARGGGGYGYMPAPPTGGMIGKNGQIIDPNEMMRRAAQQVGAQNAPGIAGAGMAGIAGQYSSPYGAGAQAAANIAKFLK